jgi:hypothetical protein
MGENYKSASDMANTAHNQHLTILADKYAQCANMAKELAVALTEIECWNLAYHETRELSMAEEKDVSVKKIKEKLENYSGVERGIQKAIVRTVEENWDKWREDWETTINKWDADNYSFSVPY